MSVAEVKMEITESTLQLKHVGEFSIKAPSDRRQCAINGIDILPDGKVVVADGGNKCVKLFVPHKRTGEYVFVSSTRSPYNDAPYKIAATSSERIVFSTGTDRRLDFVYVNDGKELLFLPFTWHENTNCNGVAYHNNRIFNIVHPKTPTADNKCRVVIHKTDGPDIKNPDKHIVVRKGTTRHLAVNPVTNQLCTFDSDSNAVVGYVSKKREYRMEVHSDENETEREERRKRELSKRTNETFTFICKEIKDTNSAIVDLATDNDGNLYICTLTHADETNKDASEIYRLPLSRERLVKMMDKSELGMAAECMACDKQNGRLYMACKGSDIVKMVKIQKDQGKVNLFDMVQRGFNIPSIHSDRDIVESMKECNSHYTV